MRIASWNVNSVGARLPKLVDWLGTAEPDVLCLQELKCAEDAFPYDEIGALGYEVAAHGTGRWNGVAVLSKVGIEDVRRGLLDEPGFLAEGAMFEAVEPRAIGATCGGVRVWSVYVPNGRDITHAHYAYKLRWLDALRATAAEELTELPFTVLGDFNIAPTDADVWDIAEFAGCTHVTEEERKALTALGETGLAEVHPRALKYDVPFTYWDYRALRFPNNQGMRIDLVFGNERFTTAVTDAYVDRNARKGKGTSDHAPVVVDLDLP
ncbi:exodeoxyribonuclease-3 [Saccharopolyspora antimicrobica]|uniref:Exodeoxyribonuclease-3 n=1 Tax=Saccharopolyspora antimicrobica TaxID=455193 RepID=A0A1I4S5N5_9PSEU|nr:exodeoxyribonuclease III [Saccharopolyspora antimicrobica]RKT87603.1 exodeoxyribonuclease-3 [Saccharopolyspora antimicrobica]SFM59807.1 exodeoxyribonuclease-3 [Saccharopolyspora antimicrobica]